MVIRLTAGRTDVDVYIFLVNKFVREREKLRERINGTAVSTANTSYVTSLFSQLLFLLLFLTPSIQPLAFARSRSVTSFLIEEAGFSEYRNIERQKSARQWFVTAF